MARLRRNEATAALRRLLLFARDLDGAPLAAATTFTADGELLVDQSAGRFVAPLGTLTNGSRELTFADTVFTADAATDVCTAVAHGLQTGDGGVKTSNSGGALPGGLAVATNYYAIVVTVDTFKLATSRANALAGVAIDLTTNGTGVQTIEQGDGCGRVIAGCWMYEATQPELDYAGTYFAVRLSKPGTIGGDDVIVTADLVDPVAEVYETGTLDNGDSPGDVIRGMNSILAGMATGFGGSTETFKNRAGSKTRYTVTVDDTGRLTVTKVDLTA